MPGFGVIKHNYTSRLSVVVDVDTHLYIFYVFLAFLCTVGVRIYLVGITE
jgi:hypothetical protein